MTVNQWFLVGGLILLVLVLAEQWLKEGPISSAIVYLGLGFVLGPKVLNLIDYNVFEHPKTMELGAEVLVIISLFSAGLKLKHSFMHPHWRISGLLASATMMISVVLLAVTGHFVYGLSLGAAVLLGGVLAPTDPVLASAVQVQNQNDEDRIRRALTGEAGLNDGTAFPVVMLGLTVLGARWEGVDSGILRWALVDFAWAIPGGLAIGYCCGWLAAKAVMRVHSSVSERLVVEDFVALGLIALSYGLAQVLWTYGFLSVFAAAVAFSRVEREDFNGHEGFSSALIRFSVQLERIGEILTVTFVGYIAGYLDYSGVVLLLPALLILFIRPAAVYGVLGRSLPAHDHRLISWFGIRGIGSVYYLSYALNHGLGGDSAQLIFNLVMVTIVISIFVHGVSASPIMRLHDRQSRKTEAS